MENLEEAVGKAGLGGIDASIFIALLKFGPCGAGEIIRKTGLNRQSTYSSLARLVVRGLASTFVKNKVKNFEAADPRELLRKLDEEKKALEEAMPKLLSLKEKPKKFSAKIFEGKEGLKLLLNDVLEEGKDYYGFYTGVPSKMLGEWYARWDERRREAGITRRAVANESARKVLSKLPMSDVRYLPKEYSLPAGGIVYGDKVFIYVPPEEELNIILFESAKVAAAYRRYFEALWRIGRK